MNRAKKSTTSRVRKKISKEIRAAQHPAYATSPLPSKQQSGKKSVITSKKIVKKISKRTTPGKLSTSNLAPRSTKIEGKRWIKTLEKQNLNQSKRLTHKLSKKP